MPTVTVYGFPRSTFVHIARLVLERARPFGFRFIAADPFVSEEAASAFGATLMPMEQVLAESDIVSLHVFLNAETRRLLRCCLKTRTDLFHFHPFRPFH